MTKFSDSVTSQIRLLLESVVDESSLDLATLKLRQFLDHGVEGSILLLQVFIDYIHIRWADANIHLKAVLETIFKSMLVKPNFSTAFNLSLKSDMLNEAFLEHLSSALRLSVSEKFRVGLALSSSELLEARRSGNNFCMAGLEELLANPIPFKCTEQIQAIILFLQQSNDLCRHLDSFMQMLSLVQPKDSASHILAPLLSEEACYAHYLRNLDLSYDGLDGDFESILMEMENEISVGDIMKELGYGCTINETQCKEILSLLLPLTEVTVSRILGTIASGHVSPEDGQIAASTFGSALGSSPWSDLPSQESWNIDVFVDSVKQLAPGINWASVFENLDHEGFCLPNEEAFTFLMSIYHRACQDPFPLDAVCGSVWNNREGQLSFLKYAVVAPPEIFTFAHSVRQLAYVDAINGQKLQLGPANQAWLCLDLLDQLCQLAEGGHAQSVRLMLQYPLNYCPEVLLLAMAHINSVYGLIQSDVCSLVLPMILKNAGGVGMILYLWHVNPILVLRGFVDAVNLDSGSVFRILDVCQELKILPKVLDMVPSSFGIRLAALASKKELIDLESWLNTSLNTYKNVFFEECLQFLKHVESGVSLHMSEKGSDHLAGLMHQYWEAAPTFLKALMMHSGLVSLRQDAEELERLRGALTSENMRLQNGSSTDAASSDGYAEDIEAEANSYFQQMFSSQLTIDAMVQMLTRFKESSDKREQLIFECMIANLFEEYRFFPKYPDVQLRIAAVLFGSVIKHQLVTHLTLGIALRCVLDALRKPADSKMFVFGTKALEQFVDRLVEWPQYCNHILQISHLRGSHPELVAFIERTLVRISSSHESDGGSSTSGLQVPNLANPVNMEVNNSANTVTGRQVSSQFQLQQKPETSEERHKPLSLSTSEMKPVVSTVVKASATMSAEPPTILKTPNTGNVETTLTPPPAFVQRPRVAASAKFGSALNIETLIAAAVKRDSQIEAPALEVQDKISFIFNNISAANIEAKAKEFTDILKEQYYAWFAQYMVMKRASIEPNFHDLYLKFLDKVNWKALNKEIVQATYENCKVLLGSELIKSSSEERSLLKNLGSWLGKLTIGRNQVLRAREIDPKSLIMEAYQKGKMIAVIPFTSKILEPCQSSLAYQPPNPWTMGILGLLAEIYLMPNLKMNLKFDIEVLFKNLGVDMKDIAPTSLLKDRVREVEGNPDFSNKDSGISQTQVVADVKSGMINQVDLPLKITGPSDSGHTHILAQYGAPLHMSTGALLEDDKLSSVSLSDELPSAQGLLQVAQSQTPFAVSQLSSPTLNIGTHVVINQKLNALGLHLHFQRVVPIVMDRAIKEIVARIVQRSVSIATQTTKELVLKDYALESDETRVYNAAHLMVASLAGSLAHVTCKEPLRGSISSHLRSSLQGLNISTDLFDQAVQLVTNDNLDLGCAVIEQAATEKAIQTIDSEIAQQLSLRRKHREGVSTAFFDASVFAQGSVGVIPDALHTKTGHLSPPQQRVYEDFMRLPWQNHSSQASISLPSGHLANSSASVNSYDVMSGHLGYASTQVDSGNDAALQQLDVSSEMIENSCPPFSNASAIHVGDGVVPLLSSEKNSVTGSLPSSASLSEGNLLETVNSIKELSPTLAVSSLATNERATNNGSEPSLQPRDALEKFKLVAQKLEDLIASDSRDAEVQKIIAEVPEIILRCRGRDEAALAVAQKVFRGLYERSSNKFHIKDHLAVLSAIRDICKLVVKEVTSWVIYSDEDRKFNKDIIVGLIQSELLNLAEYNVHMAKLIDGGRNKMATEFAISLLQTLAIEESSVVSELPNLVESLAKLASKPGSAESLQELVEVLKNPGANINALASFTLGKEDKWKPLKDKKASGLSSNVRDEYNSIDSAETDPAGFREQVSLLFAEWYRICELPGANDATCTHYFLQLHQNGLLNGDDMTDRFIRVLTDLSVAHCLSSEVISSGTMQSPQQMQNLSFLAIDTYAKLVFWIIKLYPVEQGTSKLSLLSRILNVTVKHIQRDAEERKTSFNPRPYFRLFMNWLLDLSADTSTDGANFQILVAFSNAFHALQPLKVPVFSFAWLELVSHRSFMPKILAANSQKGWPYFQHLLVDLFLFMEPFLRNADLGSSVHFLYKGTLRVLLVLLHDFPEFLCDYHFTFCDVIPPSCIQMRNIILSAFPRNMRLPDPSTPNLKIDLLAEITQSPRVLSEVDAALKAKHLKADVDEFLKTRQKNSPFLTELKQRLLLAPNLAAVSGSRYDVQLMNSLVLYVGMQAIQQLQTRTPHAQTPVNPASFSVFLISAAMDIFQALIVDLDTEGRYLFLNAIANQLRYPNTHTHYFSFVLLYIFAEATQEIIQEQITRVLFERLIVNRPHPWGLLITFIELIKNPRYNFWNRSFIRCAPEIEKLFQSVSRSCGGPKSVEEGVVSSWISDNSH
ncbi:hypothetical protein MLD38_016982 [Melastoma candidum]|uniref:Uncharacterized protein n=1 Tax=Melastoma candidum TaxID=119954 RepID=A0ACB9QP88_9MYRT|nr:hypothetical protein MLD38_016982 [Melastoma candidum]